MAADGLITLRSNYAPKETMNRLETEVKGKGLIALAMVVFEDAVEEGRFVETFLVGSWP